MSMSKKDFQALAAAIFTCREQLPGLNEGKPLSESIEAELCGINTAMHAIADVCKASNPLFDRERFLEACETGSCRGMKK